MPDYIMTDILIYRVVPCSLSRNLIKKTCLPCFTVSFPTEVFVVTAPLSRIKLLVVPEENFFGLISSRFTSLNGDTFFCILKLCNPPPPPPAMLLGMWVP